MRCIAEYEPSASIQHGHGRPFRRRDESETRGKSTGTDVRGRLVTDELVQMNAGLLYVLQDFAVRDSR